MASTGLTSQQAQERLRELGPNAVPEQHRGPLLVFLRKFWSPVPWMLEFTLVLEFVLGNFTQASIVSTLLVLNAVLSFVEESRAGNALALLRRRLTIQVRVLRDGAWQLGRAEELVPGDVVHVRMGDLAPADMLLHDGQILVDQSVLTGESAPDEFGPGRTVHAGSTVRRGEASGEVTATGSRTYFGKTAELVRTASSPSQLEAVIFSIVRYLLVLDLFLVAVILVYAFITSMPFEDIVPFTLILLIASVPVALPATYTLAGALGSQQLAGRGVLVTRLSAVEEAAAMDVLCSDKTGTITMNQLTVAKLRAYAPHSEKELLDLATLACDEATQDPIDLAILQAAGPRSADGRQRTKFLPFDPATKRSEAVFSEQGREMRVVKGAPSAVAQMIVDSPFPQADADNLAGQGQRVLAVASGGENGMTLVGLIALHDPPREDSRAVVEKLKDLGVRVVMVTGDGPATAQAVAAEVGIEGGTCLAGAKNLDCSVFAGVYPEDKFQLVQAFQQAGHVVGMTGDGVNDAPALKQAEVGIAVANATDVAKAAASLVLTGPGLSGVLAAVEVGRCIYQRMLTYTLNKIIKTFQIALFLSVGLLLTGVFVTTPRLILLLLFANDFVTMSLAADRVTFSRKPDRWPIRHLMISAMVLAFAWLVFSFAVFLVGRDVIGLDLPSLQTLCFLALVFSGQATVYIVRERRHVWSSMPGRWLLMSTVADVIVVCTLAAFGILMNGVHPGLILALIASVVVYVVLLDSLKVWLYRYFDFC